MTGKAKQKITADYVLDVYAESKKKKGKEATVLLNAAKELSKHLNEWLVVPEEIAKLKKKS
jgi:hypothetical protein